MKIETQRPEIFPVMVGTAGHVDHGKTALVEHLTGCNTDTLPEEKARGISIDLGFAPCRLSANRVAGLVDVPGHEDFIRNMVAGAASIDVLMLVVAADDGIMPQTDEHMRIVKLLRTPRVFAVITKTDLVDAARLGQVRSDLGAFLARAGFPDAPVLAASNKTFDGLAEVREKLREMVEGARREPDRRAFRMNVARVFSVKGYGTVVTGVPISGRLGVEEPLELLPAGKASSVRALQSYKFDADFAQAGACAALAVRGIEAAEVARGMTVAAPGVYRPTTTALAWVENASDALVLKRRAEVRFHSGTAAVLAKARLLDADELIPGASGFVHLELEAPVVLAAGDRFVVRSLTPVGTLGGGAVLSAEAPGTRRTEPGLLERLAAARRQAEAGDLLGAELLAGPRAVLRREELVRLTQMPPAAAEPLIAAKEQSGELANLGGGGWLLRARLAEVLETARKALARDHAEHKYAWGMEPTRFCGLFGLPGSCFPRLAELLAAGGQVAVRNGRMALAGWAPAISAAQMRLREAVLERLTAAGVNAPARGDLLKELRAGEPDLRLVLRLLVEEGLVAVLGSNLALRSVVDDCRKKLLELLARSPVVDLPAFRKATGLSRNLAVSVLEHFDGEGLTRRVDAGRVLARPEAGKSR
ncbi:MAG TPA: selenocysteine-specific translation elongation factor [Planctomycetota bacterium]|nr:selenocysteine-specific translation elongation factor [Planctomycetota bacterium]